ISIFRAQLRILNGNRCVDGGVTGDFRRVVCQRSQSKGILVRILTLQKQLSNEVTATDVVHQIAEFHASKRIVAEVLDDGSSIGITVRLLKLIFGQVRKTLEKERTNFTSPK